MNFKTILSLIVICFVVVCGVLIAESGLFVNGTETKGDGCILLQQDVGGVAENKAQEIGIETAQLSAAEVISFTADDAEPKIVTIGSIDKKSGFMFQLELTTLGAAIKTATFSEFDDRDADDPKPLQILSGVKRADGSEIFSMANSKFIFVKENLQLPLDKLNWECMGEVTPEYGSKAVSFEAVIKTFDGKPVIKLTKTYKVTVGSYHLDCNLTVENLAFSEQKVRFDMTGPTGLGREGARADMRKTIAAFRDSEGEVSSTRHDIGKLRKYKTVEEKRLIEGTDDFLWAAAVNKYFAGIVVAVPETGKEFADWVADKTGEYYDPDRIANTGDETVGVNLRIASTVLDVAGSGGSKRDYNFLVYVGPKDKQFFDKNDMYRNLGFVHTITFMACICPASIISPLAFGVLAILEWIYGIIGNYGVAIILLVLFIRLVMHPITKKSQVSMSKMQKLGPKAAELKKKYANNKAELQRKTMELYKEQGASPFMSFLPMLIQMPIWIALYSAIYASISLRGAAFLPFWITDLSVPDALFRFPEFTLPIFGKLNSFNLLPIMMGVAFYFQQKMMPSAAASSPQMEQQQKMMKIMMPLLFPLMLYKAPSGLNLYIMASTFAGVIEQHVIRKHIREREEAEEKGLVAVTSKTGGKVKKKKPKPFYRNR